MKNSNLIPCALLLIAACGTTQSSGVEPSGFLGDYSMLTPGGSDEAALRYIDPETDFAAYDSILLEPVTVWSSSKLDGVPRQDRQRLADRLWYELLLELEQDYEIVEAPGPHVMRIRVAITEAGSSKPGLDTISTLVPIAEVASVSAENDMETGTRSFVGAAAVEAELTDGITGRRLAAGVDRRVGDTGSSWGDVEQAFTWWAERLRERLGELRQR